MVVSNARSDLVKSSEYQPMSLASIINTVYINSTVYAIKRKEYCFVE
jgi:hypothetical protein